MANTQKHGSIGPQMSRGETIGALIFFPVYVLLVPFLVELVMRALSLPMSQSQFQLYVYLLDLIAVIVILRRWLLISLSNVGSRIWDFLQAIVLGFAFYYALAWLLGLILALTNAPIDNPNNSAIAALVSTDYAIMLVSTVILAPVVEECLLRGLIFGNLHPYNRILAYCISALVFSMLHVWQFIGTVSWPIIIVSIIQYIPAGIALGWTYEKSKTIWAPIVVHCLINAVTMGIFSLVQ